MHLWAPIKTLFDALGVSFTLSLEYIAFAGSVFLFFYAWKKRKY